MGILKWLRWFVWTIEILLVIVVLVFVAYGRLYADKVVPGISVAGIDLSGLTREEAKEKLKSEFEQNPVEIGLEYKGKEVSEVKDLGIKYDFEWTVDQVMGVGRNGNPFTKIKDRLLSLIYPLDLKMAVAYDKDELIGLATITGKKINQKFIPTRIVLNSKGKTELLAGKDGVETDEKALTDLLIGAVGKPGKQLINIPTKKMSAAVNKERVDKALKLASKWVGKTMTLKYEDYEKTLSTKEILSLIGLADSYFNKQAIEELDNLLENKINRKAENAVFRFEEGKVLEFKPEQEGVEVNKDNFDMILKKAMEEQAEMIDIPVKLTEAKIKASEINNLGINELLGRGQSRFAHSIPSRVFNVNLASKRINHALIPPGEVFSFNKEVGEISSQTGYRSAYVIKDGRTVLGDGGGTCQVSTTMFRAAMKAGLPIVERKAHSYRVGYYEQDSAPGIDATVYAPTADLKFLNDTPGYILIQTTVDTKKMTMQIDIYGTSDGRVANISKPKIWGQSPPPEPLYEDDPTLPAGVIKQIDWAAWGAKTSFDYKVEKEGKIIFEKTFYSNFKPWQAVYLRGAGN